MDNISYLAKKDYQDKPDLFRTSPIYKFVDDAAKRLLDICVSLFGLIFLSFFFLLIGILIKHDSQGPVFYRGKRLGKNGRVFNMLKFRTMYETPKSYEGPRVTSKDDDRKTPFGRWLRETKINELPQLWNVLIGDMSLVGPRPEDVIVGNGWDKKTRDEILSVRPGITSPASVLYHDEENLLSKSNLMEEYFKNILPDKNRLDQLYVRNRSFGSDLDIIFWTMVIIIPKMIKEQIPEGYFFSGPFTRLINQYASWITTDTIIGLIIILSTSLLWGNTFFLSLGAKYSLFWAVFLALFMNGINTAFGLKRIEWSRATNHDAFKLIVSGCVSICIVLLSYYLVSPFLWNLIQPLPQNFVLTVNFVSQIGFIISRLRWIIFSEIAHGWLNWRKRVLNIGERVVIVGAGKNFNTATWLLCQNEFQNLFRIMGVVDDNIPSKYGMQLNGCLVLGSLADLPKIIEKEKIGVLVFTTLNIPENSKKYLEDLKNNSIVKFIFLDNLSDVINQQLDMKSLSPVPSAWTDNYHKFLAIHDNVTGLPNWILFQEYLRHAMSLAKRTNIQPKIMFVDLNLYIGNKTIDQEIWFELLKKVSERLSNQMRDSDTLCFLGANGFAFIFYNNPDDHSVGLIADRLITSLSEPLIFNNQAFTLDSKIYISTDLDHSDKLMNSSQEDLLIDYLVSHRKIVRTSYE